MVIAIVVTYNGSKWIDRCFGSLLNSIISIKILAIDNGSIDGTPDLIRKKFPEVEVIETGENLGFGKANNIGLQVALRDNFDYAFLLNQDAWIETETIEKLIMTHKKQPEYGIVSPIHLNAKGDALDYWFSIYISPENCNGLFSDVFVKKNIDKYMMLVLLMQRVGLLLVNVFMKWGGLILLFFTMVKTMIIFIELIIMALKLVFIQNVPFFMIEKKEH